MLVKQGIQRSQSHGLLDILALCHHGRRPEQFAGTYLQFPRSRNLFCPLLYFLFCVLTSCLTHPLSHQSFAPIISGLHTWRASAARRNALSSENFQLPFPISTISPAIANLQFSPNTITMATMAANDRETTQPTCQNCTTSTTPLWRRDEIGSVLCNACGLFLKLHGRPRPISLKTDVIKSRNRVKSSGSAQGAKKKVSS
jgi:GATA-binding protein